MMGKEEKKREAGYSPDAVTLKQGYGLSVG